jgi:hypothetical protein
MHVFYQEHPSSSEPRARQLWNVRIRSGEIQIYLTALIRLEVWGHSYVPQ